MRNTQLENGEFIHVASREDSEQAFQLVEEFKALWPGECEVRDSEGNTINRTE